MRTLSVTFAVAATILLASSLAWKADAQTSRIPGAACAHSGGYCPAGFFTRCNYSGCWCSRCETLYTFGYGPYWWGWGDRTR